MLSNDNEKQLILIVDDVPKNLQVLGSVLKQEGHRIAFAKSGELALNYVSERRPDIILLDIMMPGMDGYEVCKKLKEHQETRDIPVIFITALGDADDEYRGFELGGVDYITKPFNPKIVKARVKNHLRLKRKTDLLESLAAIDGLTDIPNRRRFDEVFEKEWGRAVRASESLSLIMIDIDFFKKFNDNYGHAAGDECLRSVAQAMVNTLQRSADFVARYGGEEFVVILPETEIEGAVHIAEKIRLNIEKLKISHAENQVADHVTLSLGAASIIPKRNTSSLILIEAADKCLYEAKEGGRNQVKSQADSGIRK
ncbi:PleD family two-component system response regulator [Desulfococcaceae bacterium HSG8]|nr:PleD family two-component system response regulator [Desulfococcaceae bacterium HSG8]